MDLVFVIDDSGSMGEEQENLAANFPQFAKVLEDFRTPDGQPLDYRVAVTTTSRDLEYTILGISISQSGDNGMFRQSCGMDKPWLESGDGNVASTFACAAQVGTGGVDYEMPLLMLEWSLSDRITDGTNAGFLRDDALLGVVILTDEDDCSRPEANFSVGILDDPCTQGSLPNVQRTISFLDELKQERGRWAAAVIAGESACASEFGEAIEARRLRGFVNLAGDNAVFSSICNGDLAASLSDAISTFEAACHAFPSIE